VNGLNGQVLSVMNEWDLGKDSYPSVICDGHYRSSMVSWHTESIMMPSTWINSAPF